MKVERPPARVSVSLDLTIDANGHPLTVKGAGSLVEVAVSHPLTALRLLQHDSLIGFSMSRLKRYVAVLCRFGLQVTVTANGRSVARLGDGVPSGLLAFLGIRQFQIHPVNLIRQTIHRASPAR